MTRFNSNNNSRKKRNKNIIFISIILSILLISAIAVLSFSRKNNDNINGTVNETKTIETNDTNQDETKPIVDSSTEGETETEEERIERVNVKAMGDILLHTSLIDHARAASSDGTYDFRGQYDLIKDFLSEADLTIANFEGSHNPNYPPSGYPMFNAPKEIFASLKDVGYDVLTTANNHAVDTNVQGLLSTIDAIKEAGLINYGTQVNKEDTYKLLDIKGIKIAILAYTDNLNGFEPLMDNPENQPLINRLFPDQIKADIEKVRNQGADFVILYPHWGQEYVQKNSQEYVKLARDMIDGGADIVLGGHPHVVLPTEEYTSKDGRKGFIAHSMGNFISNQTLETLDNIRTEHGIIVSFGILKDLDTNKTSLVDVEVYPTWLKRTPDEFGGFLHQPVLAQDFIEGGKYSNQATPEQIDRATQAYRMTIEKIHESVE